MRSARIRFGLGAAVALAFVALVATEPARAQLSQIDALKAQTKAQPADAAASLALGRAERRAGKTKEALEELRRGVNQTRSQGLGIELHWEIARTLLARGEFGPAMVQCKVIGALPGGARAGHACAAEAHLSWRRASEALTETALALAGAADKHGAAVGTYEAKIAEATARELEGKPKDAEALFKEAISWKPDRPEAHLGLGHMLGSLDRDAAIRALREATRLDPASPEAAFELGSALGTTDEAVQLLAVAAKERVGYAAAEAKLADVELARGHLGAARRAVEAAIRSDPNAAGPHITFGRIALADNQPDMAVLEGEAALKIVVNSAPAKLLVGDAQAKKGEIDLALEAYQDAHGLDSSDPTPLVRAADECRRAGRFTSARAFGMKATQDFPTWGPAWVAFGDALAGDGQPAEAKKAYQEALKAKGPIDAAAVGRKIAAIK
jgi:tetratricopeptide (TPR) repeat protein